MTLYLQRPSSAKNRSTSRGTGSKSDKAGALYKVAVTTADRKNAGTDAKVTCHVIYGLLTLNLNYCICPQFNRCLWTMS